MNKDKKKYTSFGIVLLCLIAFSPVFKADFIGYDDPDYVLENLNLREFSLQNILHFFSLKGFDLYIPITFLSYLIEYTLFGPNAKVFHGVNLMLHILNALLLFRILLNLKIKNQYLIFFILLFFTLNPLVCESVCWITERKDMLYCLFCFLSTIEFIAYYYKKKLSNLLFSFLFFVLACLSKPMAISLPVLFIIYVVYLEKKVRIKSLIFSLPFLAVSVAISILSIQLIKSHAKMKLPEYAWTENMVLFFSQIGYYFFKPFLPIYQQLIHLFPRENKVYQDLGLVIFALLGLGLILTICLVQIKNKNKPVGWLFAAWLVFLLPILQFYPNTHSYISERYFYVSIIFPAILAFMFLERYKINEKNLIAGISIITLVFLVLTFMRSGFWKNTQTMFAQEVKRDPKNYVALNNLGYYYNSISDFASAKPLLQKAAVLDSNNAVCLNNYGWTLSGLQETDSAILYYKKALVIDKNFVRALNNLGICYANKREMGEAYACFDQAYELNNNDKESNYNLGLYYITIGKRQLGKPFMQRAYELGNPDALKYLTY